jgi:hypothetical protein
MFRYTTACVLILLQMCAHTTVYVNMCADTVRAASATRYLVQSDNSYCCMCVVTLNVWCAAAARAAVCVLILLYMHMCAHATVFVC